MAFTVTKSGEFTGGAWAARLAVALFLSTSAFQNGAG